LDEADAVIPDAQAAVCQIIVPTCLLCVCVCVCVCMCMPCQASPFHFTIVNTP
jgi:hypothetical protein